MAWKLDSNGPIYAQLVKQLQTQIVSGKYHAGDKLPSVRELAAQAGVNPNTMQKAFSELERSGLIQTMRTAGRIVTVDASLISQARDTLARECLDRFFQGMRQLGYGREEILSFLDEGQWTENEEE